MRYNETRIFLRKWRDCEMKLLNYENNETYDCYINDDKGYELSLNECGYEKCSPSHYWGGVKKILSFSLYFERKGYFEN